MEFLIAILIVGAVAAFVAVPFRQAAGGDAGTTTDDPDRAGLEAAKQAKYREIRDTELDRAQGKLTEDEFERQNSELRADAIAILKRLDELDDDRRQGAEAAQAPRPEDRRA